MRLSLQGYFDLGASFGLAGTEQIANMGIVNPCSGAEVHTLSGSGIEDEWKKRAVKKANDPELHLDHVVGSSTNHSEADDIRFRKRLADCIRRQRIELFELHIYPIGTVFLRMDLVDRRRHSPCGSGSWLVLGTLCQATDRMGKSLSSQRSKHLPTVTGNR